MEIDDTSIAVLVFIFEESGLDLVALVRSEGEVLSDCVLSDGEWAWMSGERYRDRGRSRSGVRA